MKLDGFQCLNRHEQPSSPIQPIQGGRIDLVSMPQSARATFKQLPYDALKGLGEVSMPQSARATFKRIVLDTYVRWASEVSMPQSARATFKL